jgi:hypothetical protein
MKFKNAITEQYGAQSATGHWAQIYPVGDEADFKKAAASASEFTDQFRFIADPKTKDFYIFAPILQHTDAQDKVHLNTQGEEPVLAGVAAKRQGKWKTIKAVNFDMAAQAFRDKMLGKGYTNEKAVERYLKTIHTDWSWLDKYTDTTPLIKYMHSKTKESIEKATQLSGAEL